MRRNLVVSIAAFLWMSQLAQAGYVQSWLESRGGCGPGNLDLLDASMSSGGKFLGKPTLEWTNDDFEEYRNIFSECNHRYPGALAGIGEDPGRVKINHFIDGKIKEAYELTAGRANRERERIASAENAQQDLARSQAAARREKIAEDARRNSERAEAARRLADEEEPLIAEAERQYAEAAKAREEAERRLADVRQRTQVQQKARSTEEARRVAALEQQERTEVTARIQKEQSTLLGKRCQVTATQFSDVRFGMNLHQVQMVFDCLGREVQADRISGIGTYTTYAFAGANGWGAATVVFKGASLMSKNQSGLE